MFDDRIEFVTVGGLLKGFTLEDIFLGVSILRNQNLAGIFYRLKLIEAYGTGVPKIIECYENSILKPQFEATDNAFKITLPNRNVMNPKIRKGLAANNLSTTERVAGVLQLFTEKEYIVRKDVEETAGVSQATAITLLREMTRKGLLMKEGIGKFVKYKRLE